MKLSSFSSSSQEHIKWWINSVPSPTCALFSNINELSTGTVLISLLCHYFHCDNVPETSKDSVGLIRCCLTFLTDMYGTTSLPLLLRDPQKTSERIAHNHDPDTSWCLLQFLYNLHLSTQEQQRHQRRKEEMRARMNGKTISLVCDDTKSESTENTGSSSCTKTTLTSVYKYPTNRHASIQNQSSHKSLIDSSPTSSHTTHGRSHSPVGLRGRHTQSNPTLISQSNPAHSPLVGLRERILLLNQRSDTVSQPSSLLSPSSAHHPHVLSQQQLSASQPSTPIPTTPYPPTTVPVPPSRESVLCARSNVGSNTGLGTGTHSIIPGSSSSSSLSSSSSSRLLPSQEIVQWLLQLGIHSAGSPAPIATPTSYFPASLSSIPATDTIISATEHQHSTASAQAASGLWSNVLANGVLLCELCAALTPLDKQNHKTTTAFTSTSKPYTTYQQHVLTGGGGYTLCLHAVNSVFVCHYNIIRYQHIAQY